MVSDVIERYLYDLSNARALLTDRRYAAHHPVAHGIIIDIQNYFVDHFEDVEAARFRITARNDPESLRISYLLDEFMADHANACEQTNAALEITR